MPHLADCAFLPLSGHPIMPVGARRRHGGGSRHTIYLRLSGCEGRKEEWHHLYDSYYSTAAVVNRFVSGRGLFLGGSFLPLHPSPPSLSPSLHLSFFVFELVRSHSGEATSLPALPLPRCLPTYASSSLQSVIYSRMRTTLWYMNSVQQSTNWVKIQNSVLFNQCWPSQQTTALPRNVGIHATGGAADWSARLVRSSHFPTFRFEVSFSDLRRRRRRR